MIIESRILPIAGGAWRGQGNREFIQNTAVTHRQLCECLLAATWALSDSKDRRNRTVVEIPASRAACGSWVLFGLR